MSLFNPFSWFSSVESEAETLGADLLTSEPVKIALQQFLGPQLEKVDLLLGDVDLLVKLPVYTGFGASEVEPLLVKARAVGQVALELKTQLDKILKS